MTDPRPTIYFISETFPPLARGGALVRGYFAEYLAEEGWPIKVITAAGRKGFFVRWEYDHAFSLDAAQKLDIQEVPAGNAGIIPETLVSLNLAPSLMMDWVKRVKQKLPDLIQTQGNGIVFANYPDIANFYVGLEMKMKYGLPLVLDFRDDYFHDPMEKFVPHAEMIFTASETIRQKILRDFPGQEEKVHVVYNGYLEPWTQPPQNRARGTLKIFYTGTIAKAQKPQILNLAYQRLLKKHPGLQGKITVEVFGQKGYYYQWFYRKTLVPGIHFRGFVGHDELLGIMSQEADIGFFSLAGPQYSYALPTKLFEYLNLEVPLLAALPDGEARGLIERHDIGKACPCADIDGLAERIFEYATRPDDIERIRRNIRRVKSQFAIQAQIKEMSRWIERVVPRT